MTTEQDPLPEEIVSIVGDRSLTENILNIFGDDPGALANILQAIHPERIPRDDIFELIDKYDETESSTEPPSIEEPFTTSIAILEQALEHVDADLSFDELYADDEVRAAVGTDQANDLLLVRNTIEKALRINN